MSRMCCCIPDSNHPITFRFLIIRFTHYQDFPSIVAFCSQEWYNVVPLVCLLDLLTYEHHLKPLPKLTKGLLFVSAFGFISASVWLWQAAMVYNVYDWMREMMVLKYTNFVKLDIFLRCTNITGH